MDDRIHAAGMSTSRDACRTHVLLHSTQHAQRDPTTCQLQTHENHHPNSERKIIHLFKDLNK